LQAMDHSAAFTGAVTIGGVSVTSVSQIQCAVCHHSPGNVWSDGVFHANIGAAVPADCNVCHYPLMADGTRSDLTSSTSYEMKHQSAQLTTQNCQTCHTAALARGATTPAAATLFQSGALHPSVAAQPGACVDCHSVSEPAANASTRSGFAYTFATGGTASNGPQYMNHGSPDVVGKDCVVCHASDARTSGSAWSNSDQFHTAVGNPSGCQACHGLTNGGGSVAGTNNNLPSGITNSTMVTSAASDATTGVPAGTHDQIIHTDVNVTGHDCNFCHTQRGVSSQGSGWAQAAFHSNFSSSNALLINGTTGRCSNCHLNVKPGAGFATDHSAFTSVSGSQDCGSCHTWPGTGTVSAPNWLGAAGGAPQYINVGGFSIPQPPATAGTPLEPNIASLPHPTGGQACTACHTSSAGGQPAIGYDHASALINSDCSACHEAGSTHLGTLFNGATTESSAAGDSRPFTLASVSACEGCVGGPGTGRSVAYAYHFYPVDCHECHKVPRTGNGAVTTGPAYIGNGTPSSSTCQLSGATCPSTGVACSATAPCPSGQSCRNGTCQVNCPSGQSCRNGGVCQVDCPSGLFCVNAVCDYPSAWWFPHTQRNMTNPSTCLMCHPNGVPN